MKILSIHDNSITTRLSRDNLNMLCSATGGSAFGYTTQRDIPVLTNWTAEEAIVFEEKILRIRDGIYQKGEKTAELELSFKELNYIAKIHADNMEELGFIEYPMIAGYDWEEAEEFLGELQKVAALTSPTP